MCAWRRTFLTGEVLNPPSSGKDIAEGKGVAGGCKSEGMRLKSHLWRMRKPSSSLRKKIRRQIRTTETSRMTEILRAAETSQETAQTEATLRRQEIQVISLVYLLFPP